MSALRTPAALASLLALTACVAAPPMTPQETAMLSAATSPILPATPAERQLIEQKDVLTQAKFWGAEYEKNPNDYESAVKYAHILRAIGSTSRLSLSVRTTCPLLPLVAKRTHCS